MDALERSDHANDVAPLATARIPTGLSAAELRVLGCLLEKQSTTPDAYPLSLNALRLACNQSTNRDPVVDFDEATVRDAAQRLGRRGLARLASGSSSRAVKYRHLLADALPLAAGERAILTLLMLRGPQTPGELKQRTERMHDFGGLSGLHDTLDAMSARGLVSALQRQPGQKETRYEQLLGEEEPKRRPRPPDDLTRRVAALEDEVARLRALLKGTSPHEPLAARDQLRREHRSRNPTRRRGGARVVPLAVRAAARAGLPLDGDRGDAGGPESGGRGQARARAGAPLHPELLDDLRPARAERHGHRLGSEHAQSRTREDRRSTDHPDGRRVRRYPVRGPAQPRVALRAPDPDGYARRPVRRRRGIRNRLDPLHLDHAGRDPDRGGRVRTPRFTARSCSSATRPASRSRSCCSRWRSRR